MIYIATHGIRKKGPNAEHEPQGLEQIKHMPGLLKFLSRHSHADITWIIVANATRFHQVEAEVTKEFPEIEVSHCELFGSLGTVTRLPDGSRQYEYPEAEPILGKKHLRWADLFSKTATWLCFRELERKAKGDVLIIAGSEMIEGAGEKNRGAAILQLNPRSGKSKFLMDGGSTLWAKVDII